MSKSKAIGTTLELGNVKIGGIKSIGGIEVTAEAIDVTALDNQDGYREKLPGLKDAGTISLSGFLDGEDEGQDKCYELLESSEVVAGVIKFPAKIGKSWTFNAGVTKFATGAEVEGAVTFDMELSVSGKPTLGASAQAAATQQ